MSYPIRYKAMKKDLKLTNKDIAEKIGNTPDSVQVITSTDRRFPRWAKFAIWMYEEHVKKD